MTDRHRQTDRQTPLFHLASAVMRPKNTSNKHFCKCSSNWISYIQYSLAATLRVSRPGVQSTRSLWRHWWRHNWETIRDREKRRPHPPWNPLSYPMVKTASLYNNLQNRKLRHLWRHNLGSRWKLQKMARENFIIGAFYNITKSQDNPIKTIGRDSFLSPKPLKIQVFRGHPAPRGRTAPIFYGTQLDPDI